MKDQKMIWFLKESLIWLEENSQIVIYLKKLFTVIVFSKENLYVLLFGKSKTEDVEYFLNKISQQDEVSDAIINEETCKKIQLSCEADVTLKLLLNLQIYLRDFVYMDLCLFWKRKFSMCF